VGGNFFLFHPVELISGAHLPEESLNRDLVLIDMHLAWQLFGAVDVAGMELFFDGVPHLIVGVYRPADNFASRAAGGDLPHMFLYYDTMASLTGRGAPITTIHAVLPNPLLGLAEEVFTDALEAGNIPEDGFWMVNNTSRYTLGALIGVIRGFGTRAMYQTGIRLPYWENAARMTEDIAALLLVFTVLLLIYPLIVGIRLLIWAWRRRRWRLRDVAKRIEAERERKREEEWLKSGQARESPVRDKIDPQFDVDEIIRSVRESEEKDDETEM